MSDFSVQALNELLRLARQRPLSPSEEARLQAMLSHAEGRLAAAADQHLLEHYRTTGGQRRWSRAELNDIADELERRAGRRGERPLWPVLRRGLALGGLALLVIAGLVLFMPGRSQPAVEPAAINLPSPMPRATSTPPPTATPSPTPLPTATLKPNHVYVDLLTLPTSSPELDGENRYTLSIEEVRSLWPHPLYFPTQIQASWEFIGAAISEEAGVLELAFIDTRPRTETLWILSQAPASGALSPLPVSYTTLPEFEVTNVYDNEIGSVGSTPALLYQYEHVHQPERGLEFIVYNTVTWELDGQRLTLTFPSDNLMPSSVVAGIAENLQVSRLAE